MTASPNAIIHWSRGHLELHSDGTVRVFVDDDFYNGSLEGGIAVLRAAVAIHDSTSRPPTDDAPAAPCPQDARATASEVALLREAVEFLHRAVYAQVDGVYDWRELLLMSAERLRSSRGKNGGAP